MMLSQTGRTDADGLNDFIEFLVKLRNPKNLYFVIRHLVKEFLTFVKFSRQLSYIFIDV